MMTFRCPSSLLLILALLTPDVGYARPVKHGKPVASAASKQSAHDAAVVARQAKAHYLARQFVLAAQLYHQAYELNPARPEFLYGVGRSEQMAGHVPQARAALEALRELLPPRHPLQAKAGALLVAMEDVVAAPVVVIPPPAQVTPVAEVTPTIVAEQPHEITPVIAQLPATITVVQVPPAKGQLLTRAAMWTGGALVLAGIVLATWAEIDRNTLTADLGVIPGTQAASRQATVNSLSTASVISVAAGAGALALGLYWRIGETARAPVVTATPSNVQLSWRF